MRLRYGIILATVAGVGAGLGYLAWGPAGSKPESVRPPTSERLADSPQWVDREGTSRRARSRVRADRERRRHNQAASERLAAERRYRARAAAARRRHTAAQGPAYEETLESADRAAAEESLAPEDIDALLEESLAILLPGREFSEEDYGRLTDSVLRVRAARRALKAVPLSVETAGFVERQRQEITDALATFEAVAGIPPSELPDVLDPSGGISQDDAPEEEYADAIGEPLSDYQPLR